MPEIRKATPTSGYNTFITISDYNEIMLPVAFSSFDETENIFPMEGRFPEHDNEIMVNNQIATVKKIEVGDSLTLEYLNVKKKLSCYRNCDFYYQWQYESLHNRGRYEASCSDL